MLFMIYNSPSISLGATVNFVLFLLNHLLWKKKSLAISWLYEKRVTTKSCFLKRKLFWLRVFFLRRRDEIFIYQSSLNWYTFIIMYYYIIIHLKCLNIFNELTITVIQVYWKRESENFIANILFNWYLSYLCRWFYKLQF